jgi:hypothetical protein
MNPGVFPPLQNIVYKIQKNTQREKLYFKTLVIVVK